MAENKNKKFSLKLFNKGEKKIKEKDIYKEEAVDSPGKTIFKNFVANKIAMIGVICFVAIFATCFTVPLFVDIDTSYTDVTQQNVAPGLNMLSYPSQLEADFETLAAGSTYGVGVTTSGTVYMWGQFTDSKMTSIPSGMGNVVMLSAGNNHILAVNDEGEVFTWGYDRFGLADIPDEIADLEGEIIDIGAIYQLSYVLTDAGELVYWGNENLMEIYGVSNYQGNIQAVQFNNSTGMILTNDGELVALCKTSMTVANIPEEIQGHVVDFALTEKNGCALLDDGSIVTWGEKTEACSTIPDEYQDLTFSVIEGGYRHFTAITTDGTVVSWGLNNHGQTDVPSGLTNIVEIYVDWHQNYAVDADGNITAWGLDGYLMGTDNVGRDIFYRVVAGGRMTMTVGAIAVIISTIIGVIVGGISGYYGGTWIDTLLMRVAEIVGNLPFIPFAMILTAILGNSISETGRIILIMFILGILGWTGLARILRAQILAEREKEFVTAAKALGIKEKSIIFKHILPNVTSLLIVSVTLSFATSMLTESSLSFLGFGVSEPNPTWGNMLNQALDSKVMVNYWWRWVYPALALCISIISVNNIGDGLRDAIDPHSNDR